jgi:hypothetical protein
MESIISVKNIKKSDNKVIFQFDYTVDLEHYFNIHEEFFIEYDTNI